MSLFVRRRFYLRRTSKRRCALHIQLNIESETFLLATIQAKSIRRTKIKRLNCEVRFFVHQNAMLNSSNMPFRPLIPKICFQFTSLFYDNNVTISFIKLLFDFGMQQKSSNFGRIIRKLIKIRNIERSFVLI